MKIVQSEVIFVKIIQRDIIFKKTVETNTVQFRVAQVKMG